MFKLKKQVRPISIYTTDYWQEIDWAVSINMDTYVSSKTKFKITKPCIKLNFRKIPVVYIPFYYPYYFKNYIKDIYQPREFGELIIVKDVV